LGIARGAGEIGLLRSSIAPDIRLFQYFIVLAEELNFRKAAERLFISQPVLSRQIRQLEKQLDVQLLTRSSRVTLTDAGQLFLDEARKTVAQADHAVKTAQRAAIGEIGEVRVGFIETAINSILSDIIARFRAKWPGVHLVLRTMPNANHIIVALGRTIDVGFSRLPLPDSTVRWESLIAEQLAVVLPVGHRLATRETVDLGELAQEQFISLSGQEQREHFDHLMWRCHLAGFHPRVIQNVDTLVAMLGLVSAGVGVGLGALSNQGLHREGVIFVPVTGETVSVIMVWSDAPNQPAVQRFLETARDIAAGRTRPTTASSGAA
jgi:DNA-binding transcriptional LysR family regulator